MPEKPAGAGKDSFDLIDRKRLFKSLPLIPGSRVLDAGCGPGAYTLALAEVIGDGGVVYAVDAWAEGIALLKESISKKAITNIRAEVADVSVHIPASDDFIDLCLTASVLHDLIEDQKAQGALSEIRRVLKDDGILAVVEFKKIEGPPGPPRHIRLSPEELKSFLKAHGFQSFKTSDVGDYHYLCCFQIA